jgi:Protein of unknown function (DUF3592)
MSIFQTYLDAFAVSSMEDVMSSTITDYDVERIRKAIFTGQKTEAMRLYREATGAGASEAQEFIEALEAELHGVAADKFARSPQAQAGAPLGFGIGFILMGAMWVLMAIQDSWPQWTGTWGLPLTYGKVVQIAPNPANEGDLLVVDYEVGGKVFRTRHKVHLSPGPYSAGDVVGVRYRPDQPGRGVVDTFWESWGLLMVLGSFGSVFALIGVGMLWHRARAASKLDSGEGENTLAAPSGAAPASHFDH